MLQAFTEHGIDPTRIECLGWSPHIELLTEYQRIDVALDPFPYNGGLTTCEAMWMGVPVITYPGETFASRHSLSHLSNVGLTETIARSLDEYVDLAVSLAADLPRLAKLRRELRSAWLLRPCVTEAIRAQDFMQILRDVWRDSCQNNISREFIHSDNKRVMPLERLGPYKLARMLGRGGMGAVYAASIETTGEKAAIKLLSAHLADDNAFRQRFTQEVETLKRLLHPHIVQLYGYGEEDGHLYYAMELVEGRTLQDEITTGRRFSWREVVRIGNCDLPGTQTRPRPRHHPSRSKACESADRRS